jgi:2-polyprenyl-3-methyl-5-hydroxy-6-metoxy-1,4-benzoquinol methylase
MESVAAELVPVLACPACGAPLRPLPSAVGCGECGRVYAVQGGIPSLRLALDGGAEVVRAFYSEAPFPGYPPRLDLAALRARARRSEFARLLDEAIPPDATVLDVGCGTGQLCLFLATGDRLVVGADLTRASLEVAADAARRLGVRRVRFVETDLRAPGLRAGGFDVVICSGVLHHTRDPEASFRAVARLARPGGLLVVGLYNAYARLPHRVRRGLARLTGFRWIPLDPVLRDRAAEPARRVAWLRDQYRHPEEHRHTLREVQRWFAAGGVEYLRAYPSTVTDDAVPAAGGLFAPAADSWGLENVLHQLSWCFSLGREGGLFVVVGRSVARPQPTARAEQRARVPW